MPIISAPPGFDDEPNPERYIFLASIGAGGMGETFRGWDRRDGRLVAIKVPKAALVQAPGFLERFDREARMLQRMWHPNIVPITDIGMLNGLPFFAMPFLPGGSLSIRRLRDDQGKPLPNHVGMLHLWLPQMAAALDHLHAQGVVHRDVKPGNIFFDVFWRAFLGDFGVAKVVDDGGGIEREETLTGTNIAMGTEFYMAPEMFEPRPRLSPGIDQYALAVTVYELLAGRRPFTGESQHLIVEVTTQAPQPLNGVRRDLPASVVEAVHRGLSKRPEDRFATCGEFVQTVLAHVPLLEPEPGVARLACPNPKCGHIIRISTRDAGRAGKCAKCRQQLVIAQDLSGLWTREEQELVATQLAGLPVVAAPAERPSEPAPEGQGPVFKPPPKSGPVKKPRPKQSSELLTAVAIGALLLVGIGSLVSIIPRPKEKYSINPESELEIDDKRLVAFSPKGFERTLFSEKKSKNYLVEYKRRDAAKTFRIRVLQGLPLKEPEWSDPAEKMLDFPSGAKSTTCEKKVGDRWYTVEVVAPPSAAQDADELCRLVAGALKAGRNAKNDEEGAPSSPAERTGLNVEYFVGRDLQQKVVGPDPICHTAMQFDWYDGLAASELPPDEFSIRWTGFFIPKSSGRHRFVGSRDNGLRIWVNDQRVVDEWNDGWGDFTSETIFLNRGKPYPIKIEYYEHNGNAGLTVKVKEGGGEAEVLGPSQLRPAL